LIGGEMAELPSIYHEGEYDLAGTIVGVVDRKDIVDGSTVKRDDVVIGLRSSGLHTNGYSLARKVCFEVAGLTCNDPMPGAGRTVGEELLEPHRSYAKLIQLVTRIVRVKGMAHITGGGITDNLPRSIPEGLGAEIDLSTWEAPPLFTFLKKTGNIADLEMLRTFNMGMGYLVIVSEDDAEKAMDAMRQAGEDPVRIGRVIAGDNAVRYTGTLRYVE
jgi:phosphoribosylformylglycinamidine cyclo-ligase